MASRGVTFSGNFTPAGDAVYQTNHGSAHDLAGTDRANPCGQIAALAMLLRESFGLKNEATLLENAMAEVWRQGWRTDDLAEPDCRAAGTREMAGLVAQSVVQLAATATSP
jgi:3-isopropylmalate dehydrogenase